MRNYKPVGKCPDALSKIINAVNHLPANSDEMLHRLIKMAGVADKMSYDELTATETFLKQRDKIYKLKLKKEVEDYLIGDMPVAIRMGIAAQRFSELLLAKPVLKNIAELNHEEIEKHGDNAFSNDPADKFRREYNFNLKMRGIRFSGVFDLEGWFARPQLSGLPEIFLKENVQIFRIRICPICEEVFWLKHLNHKTCGKQSCIDGLQNLEKKRKKVEKEAAEQIKRQQRAERLNQHFKDKGEK